MTWGEWGRRATVVATELVARGVARGDRVAIFAETREEWVIASVGALEAGAVVVPIYQTLLGDHVAYILEDSGAKVLFAQDGGYVARVLEAAPEAIARLAAIVVFDESRVSALPPEVRSKTMGWRALVARGESRSDADVASMRKREDAVAPEDLATILYTSGTTGMPKGVMLSHASYAFETRAVTSVLQLGPDDEQLMFLPLAHIFGQILIATQIRCGSVTSFAESLIKALDNAAEVNPTYMGSVPRLFEKIHATAIEKAAQQGKVKHAVFTWALRVGNEVAKLEERGGRARGALAVERHYADKLVLKTIRERFGKRLRFVISGGAPLAKELAQWFHACGVRVLEGYGLTETTAATNVSLLEKYRFGAVGPVLPGVDVKIAEDGEILMRGPNIMRGYWKREAETREVLEESGWFHSGDIGTIDADGFLHITDRKKDIIVTAGGKNIAPQNIENLLKQSPWISQAMVYGDKRPYLVALVTLDADAILRFARETGRPEDMSALAKDDEVKARVQLEVDGINRRLAQYETIKRFAILPRDFTIDGGELTPTLKVKRKVVVERHRALLDSLYEGAASS